MLKAETSMEFLIMVSVIAFVTLIMYLIAQGQKINLYQAQDSIETTRNAYATAIAINYVYFAGDGASYVFTVTGKLDRENLSTFGATIRSNRTSHVTSSAPLLNSNVNNFTFDYGYVNISNNDGVMSIEQ